MAKPSRKTVKKASKALSDGRSSKRTKSLAGFVLRDAPRKAKKKKKK